MDKYLHFISCYGLTLTIGLLFSIKAAIVIVLLIGILKELMDRIYKNQSIEENLKDLLADVVGITLAALVVGY